MAGTREDPIVVADNVPKVADVRVKCSEGMYTVSKDCLPTRTVYKSSDPKVIRDVLKNRLGLIPDEVDALLLRVNQQPDIWIRV
jgi:hypothetical protein